MSLKLRPRTKLGKISAWGIIYFILTWVSATLLQPRFGGETGNPNTFDWFMIFFTLTGMLGAFISLVGSLIAIVWREDRSLLGILAFVISIPIAVLLAGFLLGGFIG
ncbi:hypothetical protein [Jeotgalibaca sp. A122]|uniref:hypothetical protein n=1 Tax=Jeotgalibaca sp. A122 TaxID=3457322 RepID=UPI003FD6675F